MKILWPQILNPINVSILFNPWKLVPTKIKPSTVCYMQKNKIHFCHCWWTSESPRAHVVKSGVNFGWFVAFWEHQNFPCKNSMEIVILWVYYTILFGFSLFRHFWVSHFNFLNYFVWLRITDEGSVLEMRIWSILLIKSDLKWRIHLSKSFYLYSVDYRNWLDLIILLLLMPVLPLPWCVSVKLHLRL